MMLRRLSTRGSPALDSGGVLPGVCLATWRFVSHRSSYFGLRNVAGSSMWPCTQRHFGNTCNAAPDCNCFARVISSAHLQRRSGLRVFRAGNQERHVSCSSGSARARSALTRAIRSPTTAPTRLQTAEGATAALPPNRILPIGIWAAPCASVRSRTPRPGALDVYFNIDDFFGE
jgi:hypothetical protein